MKSYSPTKFNRLVEEAFEDVRNLGIVKGGEYAGDTDRLANFRRNAAISGTGLGVVWLVYAAKHWDALAQYIRDRQAGVKRKRSEKLSARVKDLIVYLLLFLAILEEEEKEDE